MKTNQELPLGLETIVSRLNFGYEGPENVNGLDIFTVDLMDWNLRLTEKNPVIWIKPQDLKGKSSFEVIEQVQDVVRSRRWQNAINLVFIDTNTSEIETLKASTMPTFVIINLDQQKTIQEADSPTAATLDILLSQLSRTQLSPFEVNKPVEGNQFFGRSTEINKVLQHPENNYLFLGLRRIGKTSLLKEIHRRMDKNDPPRGDKIPRIFVDCSMMGTEDDFLKHITYKLAPKESKMLLRRASESSRYKSMMFERFAKIHGAPVTFFLDELDRLLVNLGGGHELFDLLRAAWGEGYARFIMAGYRKAALAYTDQKGPFYNFTNVERLLNLKKPDLSNMIKRNFEDLRVTIKNRETFINRVFRETAGHPNYVQYYCKTILNYLEEEDRDEISEDDLGLIYRDRGFRDHVIGTFETNTDVIERALVYVLILEFNDPTVVIRFDQRDMDRILNEAGISLRMELLNRACRNLDNVGIFRQERHSYEFNIPLFQKMLSEAQDVEFQFEKIREEILTSPSLE
ncbi:AAA family ATPase [Chloroflexota bacterium]